MHKKIVFLTSIFQERKHLQIQIFHPRLLGWLQGGVVAANSVLAGELSFHSWMGGKASIAFEVEIWSLGISGS